MCPQSLWNVTIKAKKLTSQQWTCSKENMANFNKRCETIYQCFWIASVKWHRKWTLKLSCFIIGHTGFMDLFLVYCLAFVNLNELHHMPVICCITVKACMWLGWLVGWVQHQWEINKLLIDHVEEGMTRCSSRPFGKTGSFKVVNGTSFFIVGHHTWMAIV